MSLRSPLGAVLGLGSAGGTHHFWRQRVSSVALMPLGAWFLVALALQGDYSRAALQTFVAAPLHAVLLLLLVVIGSHHSCLGLQVVVEDYVRGKAAKTAILVLLELAHLVLGAAGAFAVLKIAFGSAA